MIIEIYPPRVVPIYTQLDFMTTPILYNIKSETEIAKNTLQIAMNNRGFKGKILFLVKIKGIMYVKGQSDVTPL